MAKTKKEKVEEAIPEVVEMPAAVKENIVEETPTLDSKPLVLEEKPPSDEMIFLCSLLETQITGGWHGPAAGLIKDRIAQIKGK